MGHGHSAGIGIDVLDNTTRDRTFAIQMVRQPKAEKREKLRIRNLRNEANDLVNYLEAAAHCYYERIVEIYAGG